MHAAMMDAIEAGIVMPSGAAPLHTYRRYYAEIPPTKLRPRRHISGIFVASDSPGREWVEPEKMPMILDGGCSVIDMVVDLATRQIEYVNCHGFA